MGTELTCGRSHGTWSGTAELWGILVVCLLRQPAAGWIRYLRPPPGNASPDRRSASSRDRRYENTSAPTCRDTSTVNVELRLQQSSLTDEAMSQELSGRVGGFKDLPGGRGLSLHLLTVPDFNGAVIRRRSKDGVFV